MSGFFFSVFQTLLKLYMLMRISGDRFIDKDGVDIGAARALTNTQQLLLHIQSPNQSNLLLSAPKSVLPAAFYSSPISMHLLFLPLCREAAGTAKCFLSLILDGGSNRYVNYSSSLDHFSIFPK